MFDHHAGVVGCVGVACVTVRHAADDRARFAVIGRRHADQLLDEPARAGRETPGQRVRTVA